MNQQILKIRVFEKIKVLDVFMTFKQWIEKVGQIISDLSTIVFSINTYVTWKAIPVRGPNVSRKSYSSTNYV